jgi:hypothetical protein
MSASHGADSLQRARQSARGAVNEAARPDSRVGVCESWPERGCTSAIHALAPGTNRTRHCRESDTLDSSLDSCARLCPPPQQSILGRLAREPRTHFGVVVPPSALQADVLARSTPRLRSTSKWSQRLCGVDVGRPRYLRIARVMMYWRG